MRKSTGDPEGLEREAQVARDQVDRTLHALGERLFVKRRIGGASSALASAATRVSAALCPEITTMIRLDHTHILLACRRYRWYLSPIRKTGLVAHVCLALDVHAQLEEEIFYSALFSNCGDTPDLDRSISEHDEMRLVIQTLREMPACNPRYDHTFYRLVRLVLHHVADEETTLLPLAESKLRPQLRGLGWKMAVRRAQLLRPHAAEAARTTAMTFPLLMGALAVGLISLGWVLIRHATVARQ